MFIFLKLLLVLPFGLFNAVVVSRENKLIYGLCLAWKVLKWQQTAWASFYLICLNFKKWFVSQNMELHFLFAWHLKAYLNQSLKLIVIKFGKKCPSCDCVIRPGLLAIWAHKHAGKHMVSENNCCIQLSNSSLWESVSVTFLDIFCWIHWGTILEFH